MLQPRPISMQQLLDALPEPLLLLDLQGRMLQLNRAAAHWLGLAGKDMAGLAFGVYGHTQIDDGILLDEAHRLAMIDALHAREYLELLLDPENADPLRSVRAVPF